MLVIVFFDRHGGGCRGLPGHGVRRQLPRTAGPGSFRQRHPPGQWRFSTISRVQFLGKGVDGLPDGEGRICRSSGSSSSSATARRWTGRRRGELPRLSRAAAGIRSVSHLNVRNSLGEGIAVQVPLAATRHGPRLAVQRGHREQQRPWRSGERSGGSLDGGRRPACCGRFGGDR